MLFHRSLASSKNKNHYVFLIFPKFDKNKIETLKATTKMCVSPCYGPSQHLPSWRTATSSMGGQCETRDARKSKARQRRNILENGMRMKECTQFHNCQTAKSVLRVRIVEAKSPETHENCDYSRGKKQTLWKGGTFRLTPSRSETG